MIRKPDSPSGYRFCLDSRGTNAGTKIDRYDTPNVRDIFSEIGGAKYFCRFDMISSYWQFKLADESRPKTAFRANGRNYRYKVCPMGNVQSSFHVQRHMTSMLGDLVGNGAIVYIDDIILYASSAAELEARIRATMERLASWNFYLKASKCIMGLSAMYYNATVAVWRMIASIRLLASSTLVRLNSYAQLLVRQTTSLIIRT